MSEPLERDEPASEDYVPNPIEIHMYPDDTAGWLVRVPPGPVTGQVLALLDPARLSQTGRVDAMVAAERLTAWAAAIQARLITALVEEPPEPGGGPPRVQELRAELGRGWAREEGAAQPRRVSGGCHGPDPRFR